MNKFKDFLLKNKFQYLEQYGVVEFNLRCTQPMLLRMLYATKFKYDKTIQAMNNYMQWRHKSLPPKATPDIIQFLVA